jgi:hypothetical protein
VREKRANTHRDAPRRTATHQANLRFLTCTVGKDEPVMDKHDIVGERKRLREKGLSTIKVWPVGVLPLRAKGCFKRGNSLRQQGIIMSASKLAQHDLSLIPEILSSNHCIDIMARDSVLEHPQCSVGGREVKRIQLSGVTLANLPESANQNDRVRADNASSDEENNL